MKAPSLAVLLVLLTASGLGPSARAEVLVQFIEAGRYTDAGRYAYDDRTFEAIERHLDTLGKRCLANGQVLEVRVHDIDLAGQYEWLQPRAYDTRIMRSVTWPRMDLEYVWKDADGVLARGRELVSDMHYLLRSAYVFDSGPLAYDKVMLTDWFERRFCRRKG